MSSTVEGIKVCELCGKERKEDGVWGGKQKCPVYISDRMGPLFAPEWVTDGAVWMHVFLFLIKIVVSAQDEEREKFYIFTLSPKKSLVSKYAFFVQENQKLLWQLCFVAFHWCWNHKKMHSAITGRRLFVEKYVFFPSITERIRLNSDQKNFPDKSNLYSFFMLTKVSFPIFFHSKHLKHIGNTLLEKKIFYYLFVWFFWIKSLCKT